MSFKIIKFYFNLPTINSPTLHISNYRVKTTVPKKNKFLKKTIFFTFFILISKHQLYIGFHNIFTCS